MKKCVEKECDKYDEAEANNCRTFVDIEIASQGQCRKMKKDAVANFQCSDGLSRYVAEGNIRNLLIGHSLVHREAIEDPDGFDGGYILERIMAFEKELIRNLS